MMLREDRNLIVIAHLSQLLDLITGIGGFIVPLVIWLTQKDKIMGMDESGKQIINFQISLFLYSIICIPAVLLCGLGVIGIIIIGIIALVLPIVNAIKAANGEPTYYPGTIQFLK